MNANSGGIGQGVVFESRNDFTGWAPPPPQTDNYLYRSVVISTHAYLTLTHPPTLWRAQEGERFIAAGTLADRTPRFSIFASVTPTSCSCSPG